eukprot:415275-Alexandrium_andersonii.AAC.1
MPTGGSTAAARVPGAGSSGQRSTGKGHGQVVDDPMSHGEDAEFEEAASALERRKLGQEIKALRANAANLSAGSRTKPQSGRHCEKGSESWRDHILVWFCSGCNKWSTYS